MLRSVNRTAVGLAAFLVAALIGQLPGAYLKLKPPLAELLGAAVYIGAALLFVFLLQSAFDKRHFREIGLSCASDVALRGLVRGALLGGGLFAVVPVVQWLVGAVVFQRFQWNAAIPLGGLFRFLGVAFSEEVFFRGYILKMLRRRHGTVPALAISSVAFSAIHYVNPGYAPLVLVNILGIGVLLGLMVLKSGNLWSAVGFHLGWNWVRVNLLQVVPPQDSRFHECLLVFAQNPRFPTFPTFLTGGIYGPEATVIVTVIVVALLACFARRIARQGGLE